MAAKVCYIEYYPSCMHGTFACAISTDIDQFTKQPPPHKRPSIRSSSQEAYLLFSKALHVHLLLALTQLNHIHIQESSCQRRYIMCSVIFSASQPRSVRTERRTTSNLWDVICLKILQRCAHVVHDDLLWIRRLLGLYLHISLARRIFCLLSNLVLT